MSDYLIAFILGIVEGLTEFVPISSTGHLILVGDWLTFSSANSETFNIAIQLGAILAVITLYPHYFKFFLSINNWFSRRFVTLAIAILPALIFGALFYSTIKTLLFGPKTAIAALFFGGILMMLTDKFRPKEETQDVDDISYKQASIIGLAQCLALWPGMSRSASTIMGGLMARCSYKASADFSFIIAVPVMFAAVGYDLLQSWHTLQGNDLVLIGIGFVTAFAVAYVSILTFITLLKRLHLFPFALYRIVLSGLLFWVYFL